MKSLKMIIIFVFSAFFAFACTTATNTNTVTTDNDKFSVNQNGTTATYETAPTNSNVATPATDELTASRAIYQEYCVGCHKPNGVGGDGLFQGKKVKVPNYRSEGAMKASDEKLADYITNGEDGEMPAFKDKLTPEQIKGMVNFIRKEFQGK